MIQTARRGRHVRCSLDFLSLIRKERPTMEYGEEERLTSKQPLTEFRLRSALGCRITQQYDTTLLQTGCDVTVVAGVTRTEGKERQPSGTHTN
jgi:hypothetical protein